MYYLILSSNLRASGASLHDSHLRKTSSVEHLMLASGELYLASAGSLTEGLRYPSQIA